VDSDHANKVVTRRSHTRVLRFVQNALILSHCKVQNTVEPATFRSELVSTRLARDFIGLWIARRLKLCMFGIPITNFFCDRDNEGVVKNTIMPKSTLNKKHNPSIFMLFVNLLHRESCKSPRNLRAETNMADARSLTIVPYKRKKKMFLTMTNKMTGTRFRFRLTGTP